jgi:hypothetical protein
MELEKPMPHEALRREWDSAFSVFDELDYATANAVKFPKLGNFIAKVVVPEDGSVESAKRQGEGTISVSICQLRKA